MNTRMKRIVDEALSLPASEKAHLVDALLASLDRPDEHIDSQWRHEVEERLAAYRAGDMRSVPLFEVLAKYRDR